MVSTFAAIIAGFVLSGAFAPLNWWFLLPVAVAIFLYSVTKTRNPFRIAFIFGIVFNYLTLRWTGTYVGLIPVLFLVVLQSSFYLPLGLISFKRNRFSRIWLIAPILLAADELRSVIPFGGFGWNRLSFSQADAPFSFTAAFLGNSLLSFISILLGIAFYLLWARAQLLSVAVILLLTSLTLLLPVNESTQGSTSILGIQGNVPQLGLEFNSRAEEVFNYHVKETEFALKSISEMPNVIVWPENSVDVDPFKYPEVGERISELARSHSIPIIVGAVLDTPKGPQNVSLMWDSYGELQSKYIKRALTPFGEYIPLRSFASRISPLARNVIDFIPGNRTVLHHYDKVNAAPIICYEIIDDTAVRTIARSSNLLVVQTNNATFASSAQSMQQLNISRIRAIENNRWLISVSTTGVSAIIDNLGNIKQITRQNQPAYLNGDVDLIELPSLKNRLGNWSSLIVFLMSLTIFLCKRRRYA